MILSTLISGAFGSVAGIAQEYVKNKQNNDTQIQLRKMELENGVTISRDNVSISQAGVSTAEANADAKESEADASWVSAVAETSKVVDSQYLLTRIANFLIASTRPILTYLNFFFVCIITYYIVKEGRYLEIQLVLLDLLWGQFSGITAYWFIRRSYEKTNFTSLYSKKKVNIEPHSMLNNSLTLASNLIKQFEGCRLKAYKCSAGVWTIGYGNIEFLKTISEEKKASTVITAKKATELFEKDIQRYYDCVLANTENLKDNQIAALTSLCFNIGISAFTNSTLLKRVKENPNNNSEISKQFLVWNKAGGKVVKGLARRREAESKVYFNDDKR
jgi:lysozyme